MTQIKYVPPLGSMGSHQSTKMTNDEWLTPPEIIEKLGVFDLDPCAPINRPWNTANKHYTIEDNGLLMDWEGRVWLNPPYSRDAINWLNRLAMHRNGIALTFARTETHWFFTNIWDVADALLFIKGRLHFHYVTGERAEANAGAPSVLVAYGKENSMILENSNIKGKFIKLRTR